MSSLQRGLHVPLEAKKACAFSGYDLLRFGARLVLFLLKNQTGVKNVRGVKKEGIVRSSFLVDELGKIVAAWYKVKPQDTVPRALEVLELNN